MDQIVIKDQVAARNENSSLVMDWQTGVPCTARRLILERVRIEFERFRSEGISPASSYQYLIAPPVSMRLLLDEEQQLAVLDKVQQLALAGFTGNAFLLLVDDEQISELDHELSIGPDSDVTFVRLFPLAGG